ncbi:MAG: hypothetical protein R2695_04405 [Acidimicrobiales bacterium]
MAESQADSTPQPDNAQATGGAGAADAPKPKIGDTRPAPKIGDTRPAPSGSGGAGSADKTEGDGAPKKRRRRRGGRGRGRGGSGQGGGNQQAGSGQNGNPQGGGSRQNNGGQNRGKGGGRSGGKAPSPIEAIIDDDAVELDEATLAQRRGRTRNGQALGRYLMCVSVGEKATQIATLEGRKLVEHQVSRPADDVSQIHGNIYLGRVQNVLPGMEAAFVDIATPKNAVLYRGDVQYDPDDVEGGRKEQPRIEEILKAKQSILCQVTKNPIAHKGAVSPRRCRCRAVSSCSSRTAPRTASRSACRTASASASGRSSTRRSRSSTA